MRAIVPAFARQGRGEYLTTVKYSTLAERKEELRCGEGVSQGVVAVVRREPQRLARVDEATRQSTDLPFDASVRGLAYDDETDTLWVDVA